MLNEDLIQRIQAEHRPEDLQTLCTQNAPLVQRIAGRFRGLEDDDDLMQLGLEGLLRAAETYDPGRGTKFSTFAFQVISRHISRYCGRLIRTPAGVQPVTVKSLDAALPDDPDLTLLDTIAAPDNINDVVDQIALEAVIWPEVDGLEGEQREIIQRRYRQNESRKEAAEAMQMTVSKARKTEYDALAKLRRSRLLRAFYRDSNGYGHTSRGYFERGGKSVQEWSVIEMERRGLLW